MPAKHLAILPLLALGLFVLGLIFLTGSIKDKDGEIYIMDADGGHKRSLTDNAAFDQLNGWSADGSQISFESYCADNWVLYVMDIDGSNLRRVTRSGADEFTARWSADSKQVAFTAKRDGQWV